ncbi:hypothetical protein B005_4482 [Nocardiopsis alba ATCC BAA-2165]|uniref:Uncharacterized protein n=1 Tax=Nocardiopsis alba (strain ATCC BAA-2165 / BE74) TaxID=1205910 RepID=J7LBX3_NOCAA|nr:hypothetical protein B005_4482 [Nocardiopsis alba ATCC BAA-2165]
MRGGEADDQRRARRGEKEHDVGDDGPLDRLACPVLGFHAASSSS